ncbi:hypothetical protein GTA08_BOTSDO13076 [Botryosphaeria dothidea]|uniref:Uncharacterized protein n=1 Tax=Botryosphaeria dothidea TaxID=55169 RepID=A0A8H4J3A5_9PEZI|nr:hypothetical protein GTA08_BOTSDO13076 [Botryosphaeria dothidea]
MGQVLTKAQQMAANAVHWIEQHPYKMALCAVNTAVVLVPAIVTAPVLGFLGFTVLGPAAGSIAAILQSFLSPIAAGSAFATLQSAAMGGYGVAVVANADGDGSDGDGSDGDGSDGDGSDGDDENGDDKME